jgi:hypothetical protein
VRWRQGRAQDTAILLALAVTTWLLYGSVLQLWWMNDDFFHLRYLLTHPPYWYFFDAASLREFPPKLLTPLLFFSLDLDRRLFGLNPYSFYFHHLLAFALCPAALYGVLRLWLPRIGSAAGAWLFLIGPATASLPLFLFVRHYMEAILLGALAVAVWAAAWRRSAGAKAWGLSCLSAVLYLAACLAKEVAVPLIAILPFLPSPTDSPRYDFARRIRLALPHGAALVLYIGLRFALLGTLLGGYGFVVTPASLPALALELPVKIASEWIGGPLSPAAILVGAALAAGTVALVVLRGRRTAALAGFALLLAILPVLPFSARMEPRYAVPSWIVVAVVFAAGCGAMAASENRTGRRTAVVLAIAACASGLWLNRQDWRGRFATAERISAENRFVFSMKEGDVLRQPLTLTASLRELAGLKATVFHRPPGGTWFQDDLFLCLHRGPLGRIWGWDPGERRVVDLTARVPALRSRHCSSIRPTMPLSASFRFDGEDLFWDLGPYGNGTYRFVLADGVEAYDTPRRAGFKVGRLDVIPLRVEYVSPAGWITYSPELLLRNGSSFRWSRP